MAVIWPVVGTCRRNAGGRLIPIVEDHPTDDAGRPKDQCDHRADYLLRLRHRLKVSRDNCLGWFVASSAYGLPWQQHDNPFAPSRLKHRSAGHRLNAPNTCLPSTREAYAVKRLPQTPHVRWCGQPRTECEWLTTAQSCIKTLLFQSQGAPHGKGWNRHKPAIGTSTVATARRPSRRMSLLQKPNAW